MTALSVNDQSRINYVWALPAQLEEVWQLQQGSGTTWPHPKSFFEESLQYHRVLLARDGDTPVAYLLYQVLWGNTAFVSLMRVLPDYQRKGIGTAMGALLEERLKSQGFSSYVTSSEAVNQDTKHFLPKLGFAQIGELQMHHGGEIFYLKKLT